MEPIRKCLLLPIDDSEESLGPVEFLRHLYPTSVNDLNLIVSYFTPPLAPIYKDRPDSEIVARKKLEILRSRDEQTQRILGRARKTLLRAGFSPDLIQEHTQEKELTAAHHACRLADVKKVDAVVVQKRISSSLEGFLRGDSTPALLRHCLVSPVWLVEGTVDASHAAVWVRDDEASLRAADHAAFMLAETATRISILHNARSISHAISSHAFDFSIELERWFMMPEGREVRRAISEAREIIRNGGVSEERIQVILIPGKGSAASDILSFCRERGIGILVLGHTDSGGGAWSFFRKSITSQILTDFRNMAVWINQ